MRDIDNYCRLSDAIPTEPDRNSRLQDCRFKMQSSVYN